jgi:hypothetical protein
VEIEKKNLRRKLQSLGSHSLVSSPITINYNRSSLVSREKERESDSETDERRDSLSSKSGKGVG